LRPAAPVASLFAGRSILQPLRILAGFLVSNASQLMITQTEDGMKRERALQGVLVLVGLLYCFWGYLLFDNLWHAKWLSGHSDVMRCS